MTARPKFLFDSDFGPAAKEVKAVITPAQHEAAIAESEARGYRNGLAAAEAQARTEAERRFATALDRKSVV